MTDPTIAPFVICGLGSAGLLLLLAIGHGCERIWTRHGGWPTSASHQAILLLHALLSPTACQRLDEVGYIDVPSAHVAGRSFRIRAASAWIQVRDGDLCRMRMRIPLVTPLAGPAQISGLILLVRADELWVMRHAEQVSRFVERTLSEVPQHASA